jgi:hypothetical protein
VNAPREVTGDYACGLHAGPLPEPDECPRCKAARARLAGELEATEPYHERLARLGGVAVWGDEDPRGDDDA